jgi:opacity protein-like surface antigen
MCRRFTPVGNTRFYLAGGAGLAMVTVENRYAMTAAGKSQTGLSDFNELMEGTATSGHVGLGMETLFTDNVTFTMDVGYRYLPVTALKYKGDAKTLQKPGGVSKGDPVVNADGSSRTLNMGGLIIGVGFRFYLNFI